MSDPKPKEPEVSPLEAAEKRREDRKAQAAKARDAQLAVDLDAISELEISLGDAAIRVIRVPFLPGQSAAVAVRCPNSAETKRYRDGVKQRRDGTPGDVAVAHELLGDVCRIYPAELEFDALCERLPLLKGQAGAEAVALSAGESERAVKT